MYFFRQIKKSLYRKLGPPCLNCWFTDEQLNFTFSSISSWVLIFFWTYFFRQGFGGYYLKRLCFNLNDSRWHCLKTWFFKKKKMFVLIIKFIRVCLEGHNILSWRFEDYFLIEGWWIIFIFWRQIHVSPWFDYQFWTFPPIKIKLIWLEGYKGYSLSVRQCAIVFFLKDSNFKLFIFQRIKSYSFFNFQEIIL